MFEKEKERLNNEKQIQINALIERYSNEKQQIIEMIIQEIV